MSPPHAAASLQTCQHQHTPLPPPPCGQEYPTTLQTAEVAACAASTSLQRTASFWRNEIGSGDGFNSSCATRAGAHAMRIQLTGRCDSYTAFGVAQSCLTDAMGVHRLRRNANASVLSAPRTDEWVRIVSCLGSPLLPTCSECLYAALTQYSTSCDAAGKAAPSTSSTSTTQHRRRHHCVSPLNPSPSTSSSCSSSRSNRSCSASASTSRSNRSCSASASTSRSNRIPQPERTPA
jgi:hypothetical protein